MAYQFLVVESSVMMRVRIKRAVRAADVSAGYLHEAGNADEALDLLENHRVDLALIDMGVATTGGEDLITRILSEPSTRTVPVIVLFPSTLPAPDPRLLARLRRRGVKGWLPKPFAPDALRAAVSDILELSVV